jgi:colanic acid/amylovoran biosynthesis glycosyltransferase
LQPELEMLAAGLGIFKDVRFEGFLSQAELVKLYASSHLLLHPSETLPNQDQEGVPNSVLEAMATGLPVVATRHGGIPEAVEHGRNGFLANEEDHTGLANAMEQITRSPGLLRDMGLRARDMVAERFAQKAQINQLESFYEEAIRTNAAAEPEKSRRVAELGSPFAERVPAE